MVIPDSITDIFLYNILQKLTGGVLLPNPVDLSATTNQLLSQILAAIGGGGGSGDIKSDGSVDFVAPELWDNGGDTTLISLGKIQNAKGVISGSELNSDGILILSDAVPKNSYSRILPLRFEVLPADVKRLDSNFPIVIPFVDNETIEILGGFVTWQAGTVPYDGFANLYFTSFGCSDPQFTISVPTGNARPGASQRGQPYAVVIKDNVKSGVDVVLSSDGIHSVAGDSTLVGFLLVRYTGTP